MPKRLTVSKEKLLNSLVDGFTTSKASIYDKEQLFNLSRFIVTNNNFWFTFYVDATEGRVTITQAQVNQIATNTTLANNAQTKANNAYSLAQGRVRGIAYDTEADMNTALKKMAKGDLKIGDNIFIKATGTPDYWVSAILDNNEGTLEVITNLAHLRLKPSI